MGLAIPDSVEIIEDGAFCYCTGLETVLMGSGVREIREGAFLRCDRLAEVYYNGSRAQWRAISIYAATNTDLTEAAIHFAQETFSGDVDGDGVLTSDDAIYLLLHIMYGMDPYPVPYGVPMDFDGSGSADTDDALYLLLHVMFGAEDFPI